MPFYSVLVEGDDLEIDNGPVGFVKLCGVFAANGSEARGKATRYVERQWGRPPYSELSSKEPTLRTSDLKLIGFVGYLKLLKSQKGHTFFDED